MDFNNVDFGWQFAAIILLFDFLFKALKVIVGFTIVHYSSLLIAPHLADWIGFKQKLTGTSLYDFLAYISVFLLLVPAGIIIPGIIFNLIGWNPDLHFISLDGLFPATFCMLGFSIWLHDETFEKVRPKSFWRILLQVLIFSLVIYSTALLRVMVLKDVSGMRDISAYYISSFLYYVVLSLLTLFYVRRNKRQTI